MNKPSRRAVVRTGVWAVPVVATAAAAPSFAGTGGSGCTSDGVVCVSGVGSGCKLPGESTHNGATYFGYRMVVTFTNSSSTDANVILVDFTISGKATTGFPVGQTLTLSPGANPELFIVTSSASSQRTAVITYQYQGATYQQVVSFDAFNPCKCTPKDADPSDPSSNCS